MSTTEYKNNGIHVFVFCCADYVDIIDDCIKSIDQYVTDPILSRNIISNTTINVDGYNLIQDRDFWKLLDPDFKYRNLYNHNWVKQQIFKLNLNKIVSGNALVIDAEVRFHKPIQWIENEQQAVFYTDKWNKTQYNSAEFVKQSVGIGTDPDKTFIVEATIFNSEVLTEIQNIIEKLHLCPQLEAYQKIAFNTPSVLAPTLKVFFSEYELYINYLLKFHSNKVKQLMEHKSEFFSSIEHETTSNSLGSKTKWLTFYEQIRGDSWPNCEYEKDFVQLPAHIQKEIIEVFGYTPKELGKFND